MMMMISADGEEELSCRCRPLSLDFTKEHIAGCEDDDDDDDCYGDDNAAEEDCSERQDDDNGNDGYNKVLA